MSEELKPYKIDPNPNLLTVGQRAILDAIPMREPGPIGNRRAQPEPQAFPPITEQQSQWGRLYTAANALVAKMGYHGSMQADSIEMESLKDKLHDIDGGEWMPGLMPTAQPEPAAPSVAPTAPESKWSEPELWAEIYRLRAAVKGPDGFDSWQDAATDERIRRVRAERALAAPSVAPEPVAWIGPDYFTAFSKQGFQVSQFKIAPGLVPLFAHPPRAPLQDEHPYTYASTQATNCAGCGEYKHTPLRIDEMGGYVCLTCIDGKLGTLLGEFGYPPRAPLTVDEAIYELASALGESKGWLRDYSDAVIRDAIDRKEPRAPLTDEQIAAIVLSTVYEGDASTPYRDAWAAEIGVPFARAIEAVHGIRGQG